MPDPIPVMLMTRELGPGGTERQLTEVARALDPSRFQVHVGCFHEGFRADELRLAGLPVLRLPVTSFVNSSAVTGVWRLGRYLRRHKIRLVHTFDTNLNCFGVPVARAFGVPVVLSSRRFHRDLTPPRFLKLLRVTDRIASGIVVNSESVRRELVQQEHVPARRVHLCYNGIDLAKFNPDPRLRMPVLQDASLVIGVVCLLRPEKGLQTLLRAFAQLSRLREGVRLVFVGSGPEQPGLETLAQELGVRRQCVFQPTVSAVAPWLRSIDIFVLPSLSEALSNSLMEAMACGCACIASSAGGNPELVRDNETGLLFEPGNAPALAEKLSLLASNPLLRERLARASLHAIQARFSLEASAARMREIYDSHLRPAPGQIPQPDAPR
ncbi:MAG: glycosyltransferase family 4 protein [Acidobacteriaceae bacterium]|nr:glycosyltransferase family 4 protein [Acidobacteriaceae bacterium]